MRNEKSRKSKNTMDHTKEDILKNDALSTILRTIGLEAKSKENGMVDIVDQHGYYIYGDYNDNSHYYRALSNLTVDDALKSMAIFYVLFSFHYTRDRFISNPYYGCSSVEEMLIKADLTSNGASKTA